MKFWNPTMEFLGRCAVLCVIVILCCLREWCSLKAFHKAIDVVAEDASNESDKSAYIEGVLNEKSETRERLEALIAPVADWYRCDDSPDDGDDPDAEEIIGMIVHDLQAAGRCR